MNIQYNALNGGLGDVMVCMWAAKGLEAAGHTVNFRAGTIQHLSENFGLYEKELPTVDQELSCGSGSVEYNDELRNIMSNLTRPQRWLQSKGLYVEPIRPVATFTEAHHKEADELLAFFKVKPRTCLIFPRANFTTRMWSTGKFARLAYRLETAGVSTLTMDQTDALLSIFPRFSHGQNLGVVGALMQKVDFVVGNDSGMVHLAGTLKTPAFAVCGPTDPKVVFGHDEYIKPVHATRQAVPCVGCHFKRDRGFMAICDTQCEALDSLPVTEVYQAIKQSWGTI